MCTRGTVIEILTELQALVHTVGVLTIGLTVVSGVRLCDCC